MANTAHFHYHMLDPKFSKDSNTLISVHTDKQTIALVQLEVFMLFILN